MQKRFFKSFALLIVLHMITALSCTKKGGGPDTGTISQAWDHYAEGDYGQAISIFDEIISEDQDNNAAYAGRAWSHAKLDNLSEAKSDINSAQAKGYEADDTILLLAAIHLAEGAYSEALSASESTTQISDEWVFEHDPSVDYYDKITIQAYSHYHLGHFTEVADLLAILLPSLIVDPLDSTTWIFEDAQFDTYAGFLLAVLAAESVLLQ